MSLKEIISNINIPNKVLYQQKYRQTKRYKENRNKYYQNDINSGNRNKRSKTPKARYDVYYWSARHTKTEWDFTFDEFMSYWQKPCHYCGGQIETIGLDRVDNNIGYIKENVVTCCYICNKAKGTLPVEMFLEYLERVTNFTVSKRNS